MSLLPLLQHKQADLTLTEGLCYLLGLMLSSSLLLLS